MTNFTVLTDEQAAHDEDATERYLVALRELQTENARLRAHIRTCAELAASYSRLTWQEIRDHHLAALGETKPDSTMKEGA